MAKVNQHQSLSLSFENPYFKLANRLDLCQSKEEAIDIIFENQYTDLIYSEKKATDFFSKTLYHFCRSRIAYFHKNYTWFQRETLSLINFWLNQQMNNHQYLKHIPEVVFIDVLTLKTENFVTEFPFFLLRNHEKTSQSDSQLKELLQKIKESKLMILDNFQNGNHRFIIQNNQ